MEVINQAEPRFRYLMDTICEPLLDMLRKINEIEKNAGIGSADFSKFKTEYMNIVSEKITAKLLAKGVGECIHSPVKYRWVDTEDYTVIFQMDKPKRAIVEVHYREWNHLHKHKFTLIREGEEWLIDAFNWWSDYDEVWHRGGI